MSFSAWTSPKRNGSNKSTRLQREIFEQKTINTCATWGNSLRNNPTANAEAARATNPSDRYVSLSRYSMVAVMGSVLRRSSIRIWDKAYSSGSYVSRFGVLVRGGVGRR